MNNITLQKSISVPRHVSEVKSIIIDDNLNYLRLNEGVRIEGQIILTGEANSDNNIVPFKEIIEVDVFVPNQRISEVRTLKLCVKDYNYKIEENIIHFEINCHLEGEEHLQECFSPTSQIKKSLKEVKKTPKSELLSSARSLMSEKEHDMLEKALLNEECDIISTEENLEFPFKTINDSIKFKMSPDANNEIIEEPHEEVDYALKHKSENQKEPLNFRAKNKKVNKIESLSSEYPPECDIAATTFLDKECEVISTEEILEFPFKIIDESIELKIPVNEESEIIEESHIDLHRNESKPEPVMLSVDEVKEDIIPFKEPTRDKIFDSENYMVFTRFYRVKENETYASIATKFNLDVNILVKRNNNKNLKEGVLIELNQ